MYAFLILDKIVDILYNNNCKEELTLQIRYYMEVMIMFWNWFIAFNFFVGVVTTLSLITMGLVYIGG